MVPYQRGGEKRRSGCTGERKGEKSGVVDNSNPEPALEAEEVKVVVWGGQEER